MNKKTLKQYYKACDNLAQDFVNKYFQGEEYFWVSDRVGEVLSVSDYFFNIDNIVSAMEIRPTFERLDEAYWYLVENKKPKINFENYLKLDICPCGGLPKLPESEVCKECL